jgi:type I restriction enzyme, S subunit
MLLEAPPQNVITTLGDVSKHRKDFIVIDDEVSYVRPTVQLSARGIVKRDKIIGAEIKTKKQQVCQSGQFLVAEIDAKMGGYGIVPPELDGSIVSSHYYLYDIDQTKLLNGYLGWYVKTPLFFKQISAQGSTNYSSIRPHKVLEYTIPLPTLPEQRRIVALLDAVADKLEQARNLISSIDYDLQQMIMNLIWGSIDNPTLLRPCNSFMKKRSLDTVVTPEEEYHFAGVYSFGRGVFKGQKKKGNEFKYSQLTKLKKWNFVYPKLMAWEGALGVVPEECEGCFVSPEFPVFEIDQDIIHPLIVDGIFRDSRIWPKLQDGSSGTNMRRKRVNPDALLAFQIPVPEAGKQKKIVSLIEKQKLAKLEHSKVLEELSCLLPALLHRAFGNGDER